MSDALKIIRDYYLECIAGILLCIMFFVVLLGILDRFVLGLGLAWTDELCRFLLIWTSFLGASAVTKQRLHFTLDFFIKRLISKQNRKKIHFTTNLLCITVVAIIFVYGVQLTILTSGQVSSSLGVSMALVYLAIPVNMVLISGFLIRETIEGLRSQG